MQLKFTTLSAFLFLASTFLPAQEVIDVLDNNVTGPAGMFIKNNYLYYTEYSTSGTISRINLDNDVAVPQQLVIGLWYPSEVMVHENLLYVMDLGGGQIWTVDTTLNAGTQRTVVSNLEAPIAPTVQGDDLYYVHYRWSDELCSIERKSLENGGIKEVLLDDLSYLSDIEAGEDGHLYAVGADGLYHLDLNQPVLELEVIASEELDLGNHLHYYAPEGKLFVSEYNGGEISYIDLNDPDLTVHLLVSGLDEPTGLFIHEGELYFNQLLGEKISKISLEGIINSTRDIPLVAAPKIYPSPAREYIQLTGIDFQTQVFVFDNTGRLMLEATLDPNEQLSIEHLPAGNYFLRTANSALQQFVKM